MSLSPEAIIPVSTDTWRWISQGGLMRVGLRYGLRYRWHAFWFDVNYRLQRQLLKNLASESLAGTVFILGLWRSGTTLAHELLSQCPGFAAPSTAQCMNASTFALHRQKASGAAVVRPMDAMEIAPASPQEDEFALLSLGVPTVYRAFLYPSRMNELEELLCPDYWLKSAPPAWASDWRTFLHLVRQQAGPDRRLVLKSPNHSFRIKAIEPLFPDARYLWITRAPNEMLYSNRKMWHAMFRRYGLSACTDADLERFLLQAFEHAAHCLDWLCECVGRDRLAVIDFASLTSDPARALAAAGARIGLASTDELQRTCDRIFHARTGYRRDHYVRQEEMTPHAQRVLRMLGESQNRALVSHGVAN